VLAAALSGVLLALAFPPFDRTLLLPIALVPWVAALWREESRLRALLSGAVLGIVFWCISVSWVFHVVTRFGGQPAWMGFVCVFLLALILAEWPALVGWAVVAAFRPGTALRLVAFPALWMASEHARSYLYKGFPWNLTANALYRHPLWIQTAFLWGAFGVGALAAAVWAALAAALVGAGRTRWGGGAAAAVILAASAIVGAARLAPRTPGSGWKIAAIQPNIPQTSREDPSAEAREYERVVRMGGTAASEGPDLILFPESSFPLTWQRSRRLREDLGTVAGRCGCSVVFNDIDEEPGGRYFNAARVLTPRGLAPVTYRKVHLVPFGEYVPLPRLFFFMRSVTRAVGAFSRAATPVVVAADGLRLGPAVCYEMTYPSLPRAETRQGANLLVTISNDAWYGRAGAQEQHFAAMALRAVENSRPFARAAITGISGMVDARGRIVAELGEDRAGIVVARLSGSREVTPWTRFGPAFPAGADVVAAGVLMLGAMRARKRS
jgi:apolipoprotein N-acyltransferase